MVSKVKKWFGRVSGGWVIMTVVILFVWQWFLLQMIPEGVRPVVESAWLGLANLRFLYFIVVMFLVFVGIDGVAQLFLVNPIRNKEQAEQFDLGILAIQAWIAFLSSHFLTVYLRGMRYMIKQPDSVVDCFALSTLAQGVLARTGRILSRTRPVDYPLMRKEAQDKIMQIANQAASLRQADIVQAMGSEEGSKIFDYFPYDLALACGWGWLLKP